MNFFDEVKEKINKEINPENIILIDNSHLHTKHKYFDSNKYHLKIKIQSKELKKVSLTYRQTVKMIKPSLYTESEKFTGKTSHHNLATYRKYYFEQPYEWERRPHTLRMKTLPDSHFLTVEEDD